MYLFILSAPDLKYARPKPSHLRTWFFWGKKNIVGSIFKLKFQLIRKLMPRAMDRHVTEHFRNSQYNVMWSWCFLLLSKYVAFPQNSVFITCTWKGLWLYHKLIFRNNALSSGSELFFLHEWSHRHMSVLGGSPLELIPIWSLAMKWINNMYL